MNRLVNSRAESRVHAYIELLPRATQIPFCGLASQAETP